MIKLPTPQVRSQKTLSDLLKTRRSRRRYSVNALSLDQVSQLLWVSGGLQDVDALTGASRTVPSAGATFPLEIYLVTGKDSVSGLDGGIYHYIIDRHALELVSSKDVREELARASLSQMFMAKAPVTIVVGAIFSRTTGRYGDRGVGYVYNEVGHLSQNVYLACEDLGLGTCEIGAFSDEEVKSVLGLEGDIEVLAILPVGKY